MDDLRIRTSAFGGFNKNDVLAYIDSLSKKYKSVEKNLNEKISELTVSREGLAEQIGDFSARISSLEDACDEAREQAQKSKAEQEAARNELSDLRRKSVILEVENNRLKSRLSSGENDTVKIQQEKTQIADAIIDARKNAQFIMSSARDKAVRKIRDAEEEINGLHNRVGSFISDVENMKHSMAEMLRKMESSVNDMNLRLEELHKEVFKIDSSLKLISLDTGVSKLKIEQDEAKNETSEEEEPAI